jgi:hypothetical protein
MVNYQNSKIYKIEPIVDHEEHEIYIGSSTKTYLSQRMDKHRSGYKRWKQGKGGHIRSFDLFDIYGIENCQILLIESYPCETRDELTSREGHFIRTLKCVNKNIAGRSNKESCKQYYENNIDTIREKKKLYYEDKREIINEKHKLYREKNKELLHEKKNEKILCACGSNYTRTNYTRHCKSKRHELYINSQNTVIDV